MRIRILLILLLTWGSVTGTEYVGTMRMESGYTLEDGTPLSLSDKDQKWSGLRETFRF